MSLYGEKKQTKLLYTHLLVLQVHLWKTNMQLFPGTISSIVYARSPLPHTKSRSLYHSVCLAHTNMEDP